MLLSLGTLMVGVGILVAGGAILTWRRGDAGIRHGHERPSHGARVKAILRVMPNPTYQEGVGFPLLDPTLRGVEMFR
jgi:hypothetical protein